ncbi:carboxypeptidase-like regulatory domain-containing protein [Chryseobacterium daecheongense]|uniref:carboxypeptidase-like regulatory domain-containing protein n=1 Tax=Chryseobacterium daecheongense TaxID=192389 RepID=UPI001FD665C2|nr:carboxypeptidase-like regulatory domain-containing protein [Chryseobacterium daecheongense]UOU98500.1 carboxypeptidase-like regulatory domain-containing protein [Chryseobacterium daecheongense]
MKTIIKILSIFILSFCLFSCNEDLVDQAQTGILKGKVVERGTNEPIPNVKIFTTPSTHTVFSGTDGTFEITDIPVGNYSVKAELTGYVTTFQGVNIQNQDQVVTIVFEMDDDTSLNTPPTTPQLLSPTDNSVNQPLTVELTWNSTDPDTDDVLKYNVTIKNNVDTNVIQVNDLTTNHYTLSNLKYGVSYFWQVSVSDEIHSPVLSAISKFTTNAVPVNRYHYVQKQNGNLVVISSNELGANFQYTSSSYNSWRPRKNNNAGLIAFLRTEGGSSHIYTANPDGSNVFKVTTVPIAGFNNQEMDFAWSTNGQEFLYSNFNKLYRINKDGSGLALVYTTPDGSMISECDWSYDGSKVALKTNDYNGYTTKIYVIDMMGNILKTVLAGSAGASGGLNFSVDGQLLLYTQDVSGYQDASGNYRQLDSHIFIYNLTTNVVTDISTASDKPMGTNDLDPRFSPNNAQVILMNTSNDNISQRNVVIIDLNSSLTDLTRTTLFSNAEMPDYE